MTTQTPIDPGHEAWAVTPSDTVTFQPTRGVYVGVSGDVTVDMADGDANITFTAAAAGVILPIRVTRIYSTGTTATNLVRVY